MGRCPPPPNRCGRPASIRCETLARGHPTDEVLLAGCLQPRQHLPLVLQPTLQLSLGGGMARPKPFPREALEQSAPAWLQCPHPSPKTKLVDWVFAIHVPLLAKMLEGSAPVPCSHRVHRYFQWALPPADPQTRRLCELLLPWTPRPLLLRLYLQHS